MDQVRDGGFWEQDPKAVDTGESYDLVVVGGGISGLAAAHYFRKAAGDKAASLSSTITTTLADTPSATSFAPATARSRFLAGLFQSRALLL